MDELELLKKDWQKDTVVYPKLSAEEIYPMLLKKSSSIVKWIFYISLGELLFWIMLNSVPFLFDSYRESFENMSMTKNVYYGINIFSYAVICTFIYLLFKAYKSISVVDSAKRLMENILKTRKIIKYYVIYNLVFGGILVIVSFIYEIAKNPEIAEQIAQMEDKGTLAGFWAATIGMLVVAILIFAGFLWLFYRLVYGVLLKRLNQNYTELKKLDM